MPLRRRNERRLKVNYSINSAKLDSRARYIIAFAVAVVTMACVMLAVAPGRAYAVEPTDGDAFIVYDDTTNTLTYFRSTTAAENINQPQTVTDIYGNEYTGWVFDNAESQDPRTATLERCEWVEHIRVAENQVITISEEDISSWFASFQSLKDCDLRGFDVSGVTCMGQLFFDCNALESVTMIGWDTGNVTDMNMMFTYCYALDTFTGLSGWDMSSVENMSEMFEDCQSLSSLSFMSGWNTGSVTDFSSMFSSCIGITSLSGLSNWDVSSGETFGWMFYDCSKIRDLGPISTWCLDSAEALNGMFYECSSLVDISAISGWNTSTVTDMTETFRSCPFSDASAVEGWNTSAVEYMYGMFQACENLKSIDVSKWDLSSLKQISFRRDGIFRNCTSLVRIYATAGTDWNGLELENSRYAFMGCTSLVGGSGTLFDSEHEDVAYARIDGGAGNPGYFTDVREKVAFESAGLQSGTGATQLNMVTRDGKEHGGYAVDDFNPDEDNDGLGDNLAFTVPTAINYVAMANGNLIGPNNAYIENRSAFPTRVSAMQAIEAQGWDIVEDVDSASGSNLVDVQIGPSTDMLDVSDYVAAKADVTTPSAWNMAATNATTSDQVLLATTGHVANIAADITTAKQFGTINWYVTPGIAD